MSRRSAGEFRRWRGSGDDTDPILDAWQYHIREGRDVLIVTYGCHPGGTEPPRLSSEHKEIGFFTEAEAADLNMPAGYKQSIRSWFARLGFQRQNQHAAERGLVQDSRF